MLRTPEDAWIQKAVASPAVLPHGCLQRLRTSSYVMFPSHSLWPARHWRRKGLPWGPLRTQKYRAAAGFCYTFCRLELRLAFRYLVQDPTRHEHAELSVLDRDHRYSERPCPFEERRKEPGPAIRAVSSLRTVRPGLTFPTICPIIPRL